MVLGVGVLLLALFAIAASALGPDSNRIEVVEANLGESPGIRSTAVPNAVDEPFELADPPARSATTIPGVGPTFVTNSTTTTAPPPPTTTTVKEIIIPSVPTVADPRAITTLCGLSVATQSMNSLFLDPRSDATNADRERFMTRFAAALERWAEVSPPEIRSDVEGVSRAVTTVAARLAAANWSKTDPGVIDLFEAVAFERPPFQDVLGRFERIQFWEGVNCP